MLLLLQQLLLVAVRALEQTLKHQHQLQHQEEV